MRRFLTISAAAAAGLGVIAALGLAAGPQGGGPPELRPVHVQGKTIAPGVKMTVHVFYGKKNGPGGRPAPSGDACTANVDTQTAYASFGKAQTVRMDFRLDDTFAPDSRFATAVGRSFDTWNAAIGGSSYFTTSPGVAEGGPSDDGVNVVGWARLVPKNVLAATWTYTDAATGRVTGADVFYNTSQKWSVLSGCNSESRFDIENIGTHELGHVLALDHVSDPGKQATMYPSAPAGEVKKRSLTDGDILGVKESLK